MKYFFFLSFVCFFSLGALAQQEGPVSINVYGGYTFKDKVNFERSYAYVNAAFQYGAGLEFKLQSPASLELKYLRMDTHMPYYAPVGVNPNAENINAGKDKGSVNYILFGGNKYFGDPHAKALPFFGAALGVGILDLKEGNSVTKFAWDAKLGVQLKTASAVSFKLQAYIQSIVSTFGSDFYAYPGGAVVAVPDYVSLFQFGLGGVLCFNFKPHHK